MALVSRRVPQLLLLGVTALVVATGCVNDNHSPPTLQPDVSVFVDEANETLEIRLENPHERPVVIEGLSLSRDHWRGYVGGGDWGLDGDRSTVPDYLVLVDESGRVVPWIEPWFDESYRVGDWETVDGPFVLVRPNTTEVVRLDLSSFALERGGHYRLDYKIGGVAGRQGPITCERPTVEGPAVHPADLVIERVLVRGSPGNETLSTLRFGYRGADSAAVTLEIGCSENGTQLAHHVGSGRGLVGLVRPGYIAPCGQGEVEASEALSPGQSFDLAAPTRMWETVGEEGLTLAWHLRPSVCVGDDCIDVRWRFDCRVVEGIAWLVTDPGQEGEGQPEDPLAVASATQGTDRQPYTCVAEW